MYEALHLITSRDIKGAAALLLECVSTFTCTELCSYNDFILYTVVTNILALPRTTLKKKIVEGPEVRITAPLSLVVFAFLQLLFVELLHLFMLLRLTPPIP